MADVNSITRDLQKYGIDTSWLSNYLNGLSTDERNAAIQALQDKIDSGSITTTDDVNRAAHYTVDQFRQQQDPSSQLSWSKDKITKLKAYFAKDPLLKNDVNAQKAIVDQMKDSDPDDPVALAQSKHYGMLTPQQKATYGYQQGDMRLSDLESLLKKSSGGGVDYKPLLTYIKNLDPTSRYVALQNIQGQFQAKFGGPQYAFSGLLLNQSDIQAAVQTAQQATQQTAQTQQQSGTSSPSQQQQQTPATTGQAALSQLTPQPGDTQVTDHQKWLYWVATGGQSFDDAYNSFAKNHAISVEQQSAATQGGIAGSGSLQAGGAYSPLQAGSVYSVSPLPQDSSASKYKVTQAQFLGMQANSSLKLLTAVETAAATQWAQTYKGDMPTALVQQLYQSINTLSPAQQAQLAMNPQGAEASGGVLDITAMMSSYAAQHPQDVNATGTDTTTYNLNQAGQPTPIPGMTMGEYTDLVKNMQTIWTSDFHRWPPSREEIQYFKGWDQNALQAWVDGQKSLDNPTMTIGERKGYLSAADKASQQMWGVPADSRMVDVLANHFNPNAAPPPTMNFPSSSSTQETKK